MSTDVNQLTDAQKQWIDDAVQRARQDPEYQRLAEQRAPSDAPNVGPEDAQSLRDVTPGTATTTGPHVDIAPATGAYGMTPEAREEQSGQSTASCPRCGSDDGATAQAGTGVMFYCNNCDAVSSL